jgi:tRNA-dihydrouridine synthase B
LRSIGWANKMTLMEKEATFWVGDLPVYGDVILAPMAGYSDVPYRALCRSFGSAMHYTEFVPVEALLGRKSDNRFWQRLDKKPDEHPLVFQIFGNDAPKILEAALRIEELGPDIIDINLGCSTRKVSGRGAGVGMMPQPKLVAETFGLLSRNLTVPVSGKIRLGWDDRQRNYADIGHIMVENGAALVAMHARTKLQQYGGQADWDEIARLCQVVDVPVIGNGDVRTVEDIQKMIDNTGCDAVMIGRAAIGNPWIFGKLHKEDLTPESFFSTIRYHLDEMVDYYGERLGIRLFRKHIKHYFADMPEAEDHLAHLLHVSKPDEFLYSLSLLETEIQISFPSMLLISDSNALSIES